MRTLNFTCRICESKSKLLLDDVELTPDGAEVSGICQPCWDGYQKEGIAFFERVKAEREGSLQCQGPQKGSAA